MHTAGLPAGITACQLHTYASLFIDGGESVTMVADRMGHKNATETLHTHSHLWPFSDDKTRRVMEKALATVHALYAGSAQR